MTDKPDLVERVARALVQACPTIQADGDLEWPAFADDARAAIAAVLDDLAEPNEAMKREGADFLSITPGSATNECAGHVFEAMLAAKRKELGL